MICGDSEDENGVVIVAGPDGYALGFSVVVFDHVAGEVVEQAMFPGDEDRGVLIFGFFQLGFQAVDFTVAKLGIDRQPAADGGWLDGGQGADVVIICVVVAIDQFRWVGGEDELWSSIFADQNLRQGKGAIEATAI